MHGPDCPACLGRLDAGADSWRCSSCSARYRCLRGIPDLRTAEDCYLPNAEDWAIARRLDEAFDSLDFRGLLDLYFELSPEVRPEQRSRQIGHILTAPDRASAWISAIGEVPAGPWLDLGCGSGSFLAARGRDGPPMIGLDVAMRWLLVARKRLDEERLDQIRLVCGNAERMPFRDRSFAAVVAGDVIEHVADQEATLSESHRVLIDRGRLFMASPNRLSLAPEPHVGVWGVGYLPRAWMKPYVRIVGRSDFRAIRTLSYAGWKSLLERSKFREVSLHAPLLPSSDLAAMPWLKRHVGKTYNRIVKTQTGQALMRAVGPLFHVVATRSDAPPTSPTPPPPTRP
jgi:SAM-dependent methyltransferase